jgi:hypothetical protein
VLETLLVSLIKGHEFLNIVFAFQIVSVLFGHIVLIYWYRQGDLDPKFHKLIVYNSVVIILFCISANAAFFSLRIERI